MKSKYVSLIRYDADDGMVFDWAEPHYHQGKDDEEKIQDHLYAKTLFIGASDSIENYVEVKESEKNE